MKKSDPTILYRFLKGNTSESDYKALNEWLQSSEEHARELFMLQEVIDKEKAVYDSEERVTKAKNRFWQTIEPNQTKSHKIVLYKRILGYAAMVLALVSIGLGVGKYCESELSEADLIVQVPANGDVREVVLPDGTKVWVNRGSVLKYPAHFAKESRHVELDGEAYFEVKRDQSRPFMVTSDAMSVKVLGTIFNLRSYKNSPLTETSLIEGAVEVRGNRNEGQIVLSPGQKAELNRKTGRLQVKQVNSKLDAVWHDDLIPFESATIFEIASVLERFYQVKIILSPDISNSTYSGVLKRSDNIDKVLSSLKNSIPITFRKNGSNIYLQSAQK